MLKLYEKRIPVSDGEGVSAIGMARPKWVHSVIERQVASFLDSFIDDLDIPLSNREVLSVAVECGLKPHGQGLVPDVMLCRYDPVSTMPFPYILVEITNGRRLASDIRKAKGYIETYYPQNNLVESFVLDYESRVWYSVGPNCVEDSPSYSRLLDADLNDAIDWQYADRILGV